MHNIETLRFLSPYGEFICSPEGHLHIEVIRELRLSDKEDEFAAFLELVMNGYAIITVYSDSIVITHLCELTSHQYAAIESLAQKTKRNISVIQDDVA